MDLTCECGRSFRARGAVTGGVFRCPSCDETVIVPGDTVPLPRVAVHRWVVAVLISKSFSAPRPGADAPATRKPRPAAGRDRAGLVISWARRHASRCRRGAKPESFRRSASGPPSLGVIGRGHGDRAMMSAGPIRRPGGVAIPSPGLSRILPRRPCRVLAMDGIYPGLGRSASVETAKTLWNKWFFDSQEIGSRVHTGTADHPSRSTR